MNTIADTGARNTAGTDAETRAALAKAIIRLFDEWALDTPDRATLLGLAGNSRTTLNRYRSGKPLGNSRDLLDRAGHLLGIHKNLMLLFPENPQVRNAWMRAANRRFGNKTPIQVIDEQGLTGLLMVRAELERLRGQ